MQSAQRTLNADSTCLAWLQGNLFTRNNSSQVVVCIDDPGKQTEGARFGVLVSDLRLHMYHGFAPSNIEVSGIDVGSRCSQVGV